MGGNWEERIQKETTVLLDQFQSIGSHKSYIIYTIAAIEIQNKYQECTRSFEILKTYINKWKSCEKGHLWSVTPKDFIHPEATVT